MEESSKKPSETDLSSIHCKVVIVGAGMAGLSAANHLISNGFTDFVILEARSRIGGRIVGINVGSQKIELGANWIHGILGNPMFEMAMSHGLIDIVSSPKPHKIVATTEQGHAAPFQILSEIYEAYICFLRRCEEYYLSEYLPPDGIVSVGDHIALEVEMFLAKIENEQERHLKQLIFDCLLKRETCITGCDSMREIDLLELGSYTELQGGNITLPAGYSAILEPISKCIPPEKLLVKHAVSAINWCFNVRSLSAQFELGDDDSDDSDRTVIEEKSQASNSASEASKKGTEYLKPNPLVKSKRSNVEITCENGRKIYSDHIICTLPLGVLKDKHESLFHPNLPEAKIEAINHLLFGTVDKIFLEYDRPFLSVNISEVMLLWEPCDCDNEDVSNIWFRKIYSFSKVSETVLLGWISGREAEYMETLPTEIVAQKCTEILRKFLNDPFVPKPKHCVCTSWYSQPYTRGSYTSMAVGSSQIDIQQLAQPLYSKPNQIKPVVLFAGEHTHTNFYSTVHGAYLTGRTAAQALLENTEDDETPQEYVLDCDDTNDLSSWIQGISLN